MATLSFRLKAFLTHLSLSSVIAVISAFIVFYVWYPAPLDIAMGVTTVFLILLGADVVLGPILTLLLASKPDKKGLKLDIAIIAMCQLLAYGYGMYSIAQTRPAWVVFDQSRFDLVAANSVDYVEKDKITFQYINPAWNGVQYIGLRPPKDGTEQTERLFYELRTGTAPSMRAHFYQPLENNQTEIIEKQQAISLLPDVKRTKIINKYPHATGWFLLKTYTDDMIVIIDAKNASVLGVENMNPNSLNK